jgi:hypothetical protein
MPKRRLVSKLLKGREHGDSSARPCRRNRVAPVCMTQGVRWLVGSLDPLEHAKQTICACINPCMHATIWQPAWPTPLAVAGPQRTCNSCMHVVGWSVGLAQPARRCRGICVAFARRVHWIELVALFHLSPRLPAVPATSTRPATAPRVVLVLVRRFVLLLCWLWRRGRPWGGACAKLPPCISEPVAVAGVVGSWLLGLLVLVLVLVLLVGIVTAALRWWGT